jgi:collagenase-like PrtC family protease
VFVALNTYPQASKSDLWRSAVDRPPPCGVDAVILADPGLMAVRRARTTRNCGCTCRCRVRPPITTRINFYREQFGIARAVLPRVLSMTQVEQVIQKTPVEIEVFGFGSLCVMVEGRCALSSYVTGEAPNTHGVCSPPKAVRWQETPQGRESRLNGVLIDRYAPGENAGYPTLCKGRFDVATMQELLRHRRAHQPEHAGTAAPADGWACAPSRSKAASAARPMWRRSPRCGARPSTSCRSQPAPLHGPEAGLDGRRWTRWPKGQQHTLGAYHRPWK